MDRESPVFGRRSVAAGTEPALRRSAAAAGASWRADGGRAGRWTVRAASVAGVRHRLAGSVVEDSFAWCHDGTRLALAVADGLGSVPGSDQAATRAAAAAVEAAVAAGLAAGVRAANLAAAGGGATTLVLALVDQDGTVRAQRVGDSTAFVVGAGGGWAEVFGPPDADRPGTETDALPAEWPATESSSEVRLEPGAVLVLASDGIADPWRDGPTTVAPALTAALLDRPSAPDLARLADFSRQGCHDDRTMVCLWLASGDHIG